MSGEDLPHPQPDTEGPKESPLLPVTKEAEDRALAEIAKDPEQALAVEAMTMAGENPHLTRGLVAIARGHGVSTPAFTEAVMWTYRILREQAAMQGNSVPVVSDDLMHIHMNDIKAEFKTLK